LTVTVGAAHVAGAGSRGALLGSDTGGAVGLAREALAIAQVRVSRIAGRAGFSGAKLAVTVRTANTTDAFQRAAFIGRHAVRPIRFQNLARPSGTNGTIATGAVGAIAVGATHPSRTYAGAALIRGRARRTVRLQGDALGGTKVRIGVAGAAGATGARLTVDVGATDAGRACGGEAFVRSSADGAVGLEREALTEAEVSRRGVAGAAVASDASLAVAVSAAYVAFTGTGTALVGGSARGTVGLLWQALPTAQIRTGVTRTANGSSARVAVGVRATDAADAGARDALIMIAAGCTVGLGRKALASAQVVACVAGTARASVANLAVVVAAANAIHAGS
jgi:hypothetical protein